MDCGEVIECADSMDGEVSEWDGGIHRIILCG